MPQSTSGTKTLILTGGVFLSLGLSLVMVPTPLVMTAALFLPSSYCMWAAELPRPGWLVLTLVPALIGLAPPFQQGALLYGVLVLSGIGMWALLKRSLIGLAVALPVCLLLFIFLIGLALIAQEEGVGLYHLMQQWVGHVMAQVSDLYATVLSPDDMKTFQLQRPQIETAIVQIIPALCATGLIFLMWLNLLIVAGFKRAWDLKNWRTPDWVVALFILSALGILTPQPMLQAIGYNLLIIVAMGYFFQGLSIVAFYMDARHWAVMARWIIYLLILSQFYIMMTVALGGLFDTWFYFRKRIKREGEQI